MIKSITVVNYKGEELILNLTNPWETGIAVTSIEGLGPVKATINTSALPTMDGDLYNSSRLNGRNITMSLRFLGSPDIEASRYLSYKFFPIKRPLTLIIETDRRIVETTGYVESNEPSIFSKEEGTSISIICPDAYFYGHGSSYESTFVFSGITGGFTFAFEDNHTDSPTLTFGEIKIGEPQVMYYSGDAPTGINIKINVLGAATNIKIYNTISNKTLSIDTTALATIAGGPLRDGDLIEINTVKGSKYAILHRDGNIYNILSALGKNAQWLEMLQGDNIFAYTADTGAVDLSVEISNKFLFEGV